MVRFRSFKQSPTGKYPWAAGLVLATAGPVFAAPSPNETLNAAVTRELGVIQQEMGIRPAVVEDDSAPRRLPGVDEAGVRPVSDQQPASANAKPQPSASQLEVMKQLEEMYKRDGREMPSMRMKDAPNTYLPKEQMPQLKPSKTAAASQPTQVEPAHTSTNPSRSTNNYSSLFAGNATQSTRKPSFLERLRGQRSSNSTSTKKDEGGFFGKLMTPFRRETKPRTLPHFEAPAPAPLPESFEPSNIAEQQPFAAPRQLEITPARSLEPRDFAGSSPTARGNLQEASRESNPFAEANESIIVINPSRPHPFEDAFVEVRGEAAPEIATVAAVDPEFVDANAFDVTAPRTLDPQTVADSDAFAPVSPEIEQPQKTPAQATAARYAELQRKLAERSGLGGFQGFCPVALRDRRELIDARPEFLSIHESRTYELASAEAKARFEANPAKYAPISRGNDVVLVSQGESEAEGNLHYAVWYKDRLYLFRTPATLREFNADPVKFAVAE